MRRRFSIPPRTEPSRRSRLSRTGLNSFTYMPLHDVDEIRLLNIAPRHTTAGSRILKDSIQHVLLSASPLYTAISWMWGIPGDLIDFEVDGYTLIIQRNLRKVIEHLRDDYQTRRVWIDAICIDQKNIQERNHQVQMMGKIYRNANYVVACLNAARPRDSKHLKREAEDLHRILLERRYSTNTSLYRHFFGNQYFTRRWIIQEITQARAVIFCCEGHLLPMSILKDSIKDFSLETRHDTTQGRSYSSEAERMAESRAIQLCSTEPQIQSSSTSMEDLLYLHEMAECSDFRDKIYALISLTPDAQAHLPVDYDIDRVQLMLTVLNFSHTYQNLSAFRTLSFMSFLRQHLEVRRDELRKSILNLGTPMLFTNFAVCGTVRGWIETLHPGRDVEEVALRIRNRLPALFPRPQLSLNEKGPSMPLEIDLETLADTELRATVGIPGIDQCLFSFRGHEPGESRNSTVDRESPPRYTAINGPTNGPLFAGLASTRVNLGDEIWQFDRTPLAVIARKTLQGYALVGRAFLIRDLRAESQNSWSRLEDEIVWIRDGTNHPTATPVISVDLKGLHELMTWVNLDQ
ncbi:heterokaryon incompatibility protein-domain-containing protein [Xylogone sp. PMI_703]|nr:heterokaryon incompatibility protein-domain-containing protein [Xylogone sp. PMI_703]